MFRQPEQLKLLISIEEISELCPSPYMLSNVTSSNKAADLQVDICRLEEVRLKLNKKRLRR